MYVEITPKKSRDPNGPKQLPSKWAAVTISSGAEVAPKRKQPMTVFDIDSRSALPCVFDSHYRPNFVCLAPFACQVLVHISSPPLLVKQVLVHLLASTRLDILSLASMGTVCSEMNG